MNINLKNSVKSIFMTPSPSEKWYKKFLKSGFSLVELVVVIAIMAVMLAVLAPALMGNTERSRAQKDLSAMSEVTSAIQLAMTDQDIYDEMTGYSRYGNVSCYVDSKNESSYTNDNISTMAVNQATSGEYTFGDDSRLLDETPYYAAGNMKGLTITFEPKSGNNNHTKYEIKDAVVNKFINNGEQKLSNVSPLLYNRLKSVVSDIVEQDSQTYRNSEYTVFVRLGSAQKAVKIYGQYDGTNLQLRETPNTNVTIDRKPSESPDPIPPVDPNPGGGSGGGGGTVTPTLPHAHAYVDKIVSATCESKGYTEHVCDCGHSYQDKEVAALGHDMKEVSRTESTCKVQGTVIKKCSRCTERNTENLPLASHKWATITTKAPTCTETGLKQDVCRVCKGTQNNVVIPAKGHQWVKKTETATCTMPGIVYDECSVCKMQQNRHASQALGHDYRETTRVESTCTTQGYIVRACSRQGCTESVTTKLDLLPHNYNHVVERAATCKQTGYEYDQCTMCSQKINEQTKPVLPHNMVEVGRIEPTCSKEGSITTQCSMCKAVNRTTLPKTQHTYETRVQNATCTVAGYEKQICRYCGYVASNHVINALGHEMHVIQETQPTYNTPGIKIQQCIRPNCNYQTTQQIPATNTYKAYAFLSNKNASLNFVRSMTPLKVGDVYDGKPIFKVYEVDEIGISEPGWIQEIYENVYFYDQINPQSTAGWFLGGVAKPRRNFHNLEKLNTSNTTNMSHMFSEITIGNLNISTFDTRNVELMVGMFDGTVANSICLSNFANTKTNSMALMFQNCKCPLIELKSFNTSNTKEMYYMFYGCETNTLDLRSFDTSNTSDMDYMFANSTVETIDCSSFTTQHNPLVNYMFMLSDVKTIYASDKFTVVDTSNGKMMFRGATNVVGGNGTRYDETKIHGDMAVVDTYNHPGYFSQLP